MSAWCRERSKSATPPRPSLPDHYVKEETPPSPPSPPRPPPVMILSKRGSVEEPLPPRPPPPFLYTSTLPPPAPKKYRSKSNDFKSKTLPVRKSSSAKEKPLQRVQPLQLQSQADGEDNNEGDGCSALSTLAPPITVTDTNRIEKNNSPPPSDPATVSQGTSGSETIFLTSFRKASKNAPKNSLGEIGEIDEKTDRAGVRVAVVAANGVRNCIDDKADHENDSILRHNKETQEERQVEKSEEICFPFIKSCSPVNKCSSPESVDDNEKTKLKNSDTSAGCRKQKNASNNIGTDSCPEQMKSQKYPVARESLVSRAKHESQEQLRKFKKNVSTDECKTKCSTSHTKQQGHDNKSSSRSSNRTSSTSSSASASSHSDRNSPDKNRLKNSVNQPNRMSPVLAIKSIMRKSEPEKKKKKKTDTGETKPVKKSPIVLEDKYSRVLIAGRQHSHSPTPSLASTTSDTTSLAPSSLSLLSDLLSDKEYHDWLCSGLRESKNNLKDLQDLDRYVLDMIAFTQDIKTPRASLIAKDKKSSKEFDELIKILSYKKRHSTNYEMKKSLQIIIDFIGDKKEVLKSSKSNSISENSLQHGTFMKFIEPRFEEAGDCFLDCQLEEQEARTVVEEGRVSVTLTEPPRILVCSPEKENRPVPPVPSPRLKRLMRGGTKSPTPSTASTASTARVSISSFNSLIQDLYHHSAGVEQKISGPSVELKDQSYQEVWLKSMKEKMESLLLERDSHKSLIEDLKNRNISQEKRIKQLESANDHKKLTEEKELEKKLKTKSDELETLEKEFQAEKKKLIEENFNLNKQIKVTQNEHLEFEKQKEEIKERQKDVNSLNELVIKLNDDLDKMKTDSIKRESQFEEMKAKNKKLENLKVEFDKIRVEENSIFEGYKDDNKILKDKVEELEDEKNKIKSKETRLFKETELMNEELEELRASFTKKVRQLEDQLAEEQVKATEANKVKKMLDDKLREAENNKEKDEIISKLKADIRKRGILMRDAQNTVMKLQNENSKKSMIKQMKNQIEDLESENLSLARARKNAEIDLEDIKLQLEEISKSKSRSDEKYSAAMKENAALACQVEEGEEELQDILKKYKNSVSTISTDQVTIQEQSFTINDLEHENAKLKEKNLELLARIDSLETDCIDLNQHRKSKVKISELEQKLELELTNKMRLENQVERLKETAKKTERDNELERFKYQADSEKHRKFLHQFRDLKEDYLSLQGKESDTAEKNSHLNKKIELVESENIILKKDLDLALKRIDDFHTAISSELDSDSDTITFSDEDFLETLSQSRQSSIRDSIAQEISDLSSKKV